MSKEIYCVGCGKSVEARLTDGAEIYPHRADLSAKQFYRCDSCANYVGCHSGDGNSGEPLGVIPTPELRAARMTVHAVSDPLWRSGKTSRGRVYKMMRDILGYDYHSGETRTVEECQKAREAAEQVKALTESNV